MRIVDKIYEAANFFPDSEKFGLRSQSTKAATSIPSNIAEGSAKRSEKDYKRYLEISLGSCFELETHLLIVEQRGWFPKEVLDELLELIIDEQRMISKFIDKIS